MGRSYKIKTYKRIYRRSWWRIIGKWLMVIAVVALLFLAGWKLYDPLAAVFEGLQKPAEEQQEEQLPEESVIPPTEETAEKEVPAETPAEQPPATEPPIVPPVEESKEEAKEEVKEEAQPSVSTAPAVAILYLSEAIVHDSEAFAEALADAKSSGMDSVMLDIKDRDGWTIYPVEYLEGLDSYYRGKPLIDLKTTVEQIKAAGLKPLASIYSFMDRRFPLAQTYAGILVDQSDYFWMNKAKENGGHCWPNPYSPIYIDYMKKLISDVGEAGFEEIVLREFRFPIGLEMNRQRFVYDEGVGKLERLKTLDDEFRSYAEEQNMILRIEYPAADLLGEEAERYDGDAAQLLEDGCIVDISAVEAGELSATLSAIKGKAASVKLGILASSEEQVSALKAADFDSYILTK